MSNEQQTATWYVTFGLDTQHRGTYTEVVVDTVEQVTGYDVERDTDRVPGDPVDLVEQERRVREAAIESYGRAWAFDYPPHAYSISIQRYGMKLRERIGTRRPDGSYVPVEPVAVPA